MADLAGEPVPVTGVDGCGAPIFGLTLTGLARAFRAWALGAEGSAERRTYDAVRAHPEWLGGTGRDVTALIRGVPGLVAKDGAEAVYAAALPDGRAVALKIEDGGQRARPPVMAAALRALGVDEPVLGEQAELPLLGGGSTGRLRPRGAHAVPGRRLGPVNLLGIYFSLMAPARPRARSSSRRSRSSTRRSGRARPSWPRTSRPSSSGW